MGVSSLRALGPEDLPRAAGVLDGETFRRVRHVVTENQRMLDTVAALRAEGPAAVGPFLNASHVSMRDDFEISTPELDLAAIALVRNSDVPRVKDGIAREFARAGFTAPRVFPVSASAGASREE
ncbi:hypothetical protein [Pseudarthrobacter sp. H2]|uniref:hypothetical protein n=1 Tax=Pseudarthrobacter sp. H2 TaxID=3418415 RepID=UPI003CFACC9C